MKYKGTYFNMWDAWYVNDNDTVHAFHLKEHAGENWNVGHIYTKDLLHFKPMRDILETLPEEKYPDDCLGKFTGCAVMKDGVCYLYYTMRDKNRSEKIGLATSTDMEHFSEYEHNPVLVPDKKLFKVCPKGKKTDCRDMLVVFDDERGKYFGYFAAMAEIPGRGELGVIGVAESENLIDWKNQKIVYVPEFNGVVEVPNVFRADGKWYMTLMTSAQYGAKGAVSDPNLNSFIIWASSDEPDGEFVCGEENVFIGTSAINGGYALRCVDYKGKKYAMYIERSANGFAISLPKEVRAENGKINPYYSDILKTLRTGKRWENVEFSRVPTAFAWERVIGGELFSENGKTTVNAFENGVQAFFANGVAAKSLEIRFDISGDFREAGFVLYRSENEFDEAYGIPEVHAWRDFVWDAAYISFDKEEGTVSVSYGLVNPVCKRSFDFSEKDTLCVRATAGEGQLDVYIDDILFIQCAIDTKKYFAPGLFAYSGRAEFENLKFYELEN